MGALAGGGAGSASPGGERTGLVALGAAAVALNLLAAGAVARGHAPVALAVALIPAALVVLGALVASERSTLLFAGLALGLIGAPVSERLPLPAGPGVWASDLLVAAAVGAWLLRWALSPTERRPVLPRTPVLGLALLAFTASIALGSWRGSEAWRAALVGMPMRLAAYAAIAFALGAIDARRALAGLTAVFYAGTAWQTLLALYHIATGTSATAYAALSTGGTRYLGVSVATYLAGALLLALIHLARRSSPVWLHGLAFALAAFTVLIAYTRTVYLALVPVLLVLLVVYPRLRALTVRVVPLAAPALILGLLFLPRLAPGIVTTLVERVASPPTGDSSVQWRARAYEAVLTWGNESPVWGIGFGRKTTFWIDGMPNVIEGDPHNGFIYVYVGAGGVALLALLVLFGVYVLDAARRFRTADADGRALVLWCVATWFVFVLHAAAEPVFTEPEMILAIWVLMVLPALVTRRGAPGG